MLAYMAPVCQKTSEASFEVTCYVASYHVI